MPEEEKKGKAEETPERHERSLAKRARETSDDKVLPQTQI